MANELENLHNASEHMSLLVVELVRDVHAKRLSAYQALAMLDALITVVDKSVVDIPPTTRMLIEPHLNFFGKARNELLKVKLTQN